MNDIVEYCTQTASAGTLAVVGLTAAMAVVQVDWPVNEKPVYEVHHINPSYSPFIEKFLTSSPISKQMDFAREIAEFYAFLSEGQEPLGSEFEAVWDANVDNLYES